MEEVHVSVYKKVRLSLFGRSLIGVIFKIQDYETNLKLDTFLQIHGCNIWGIFLDSHLCILLALQNRRVTLLS